MTVAVAILLLVVSLNHYDQRRLEARQQAEVAQELRVLRARIEGLLDKYLYLAAGLGAYVATHPDVSPDEFAALIQHLAQGDALLRSASLAGDSVPSYVYAAVPPPAGGETLRLHLHLPLALSGRAGGPTHQALVEIGLDQPALLTHAGLPAASERLLLVLRNEDGRILAGTPELFADAQAELAVMLPEGSWTLAGRARPPVHATPWQVWLGAVCALLAGVLTWLLRREQLHTRRLALHDCLTGLPNRRLLQDRVQQACTTAARSGRRIALMYLDLDNFKPVNDNYGHHAGDQVLREVALRLRGCVRRSDTVARVSGDEFVLVLEELAAAPEAEAVADKVLASFARPIISGEHAFVLGCSIGLVAMDPGCDVDQALARADSAMYQAKRDGKNSYRWYSAEPEQLQLAVPAAVACACAGN
jgi:diguanylate cyclase (GGDEF)-like protein